MENVYIPKCCNEHRSFITKSKNKNLDISKWQFPLKTTKAQKQFALNVEEEKPMNKIMKIIADVERKTTIQRLSSHLELKEVIRIANLLGIDIESKTSLSTDFQTPPDKILSESEFQKEDIQETNMYEDFFSRQIVEENEIFQPNIHADIAKKEKMINDFYKWMKNSKPMGDSISGIKDESNNKNSKWIKPENMHKIFKIGLLKPTLCPHFPCIIRETKVTSHSIPKPYKSQRAIKKNEKETLAFKQAFYIPPAERFRKEAKQEEVLNESEMEFLTCMTVKKYIKYLNDNSQPLPNLLENLQKKYKNYC